MPASIAGELEAAGICTSRQRAEVVDLVSITVLHGCM